MNIYLGLYTRPPFRRVLWWCAAFYILLFAVLVTSLTHDNLLIMVPIPSTGDILADTVNVMKPAIVMCSLYPPDAGSGLLFSIHNYPPKSAFIWTQWVCVLNQQSLPTINMSIEVHYRQAFVHMICFTFSMAAEDTCGNHNAICVKGGGSCHPKPTSTTPPPQNHSTALNLPPGTKICWQSADLVRPAGCRLGTWDHGISVCWEKTLRINATSFVCEILLVH